MRANIPIPTSIRLVALVCLIALGIASKAVPDVGDIARGWINAPAGEQIGRSHGSRNNAHAELDHPEVGGHCHPGLDCSLTAVMSGQERVSFWRRLVQLSIIHNGHHLASFTQIDDPPPPRGSVLM